MFSVNRWFKKPFRDLFDIFLGFFWAILPLISGFSFLLPIVLKILFRIGLETPAVLACVCLVWLPNHVGSRGCSGRAQYLQGCIDFSLMHLLWKLD